MKPKMKPSFKLLKIPDIQTKQKLLELGLDLLTTSIAMWSFGSVYPPENDLFWKKKLFLVFEHFLRIISVCVSIVDQIKYTF